MTMREDERNMRNSLSIPGAELSTEQLHDRPHPIYIQPGQQRECLASARSLPQLRLYQPGFVHNSVEPVAKPPPAPPGRSDIPTPDTSRSPITPQTPDDPVSPRWRARQILSARWSLPTPSPTGWNINPTPPVPEPWSEAFADGAASYGWSSMQQRDEYIDRSNRIDKHHSPNWFQRQLSMVRRVLSRRHRRVETICSGCDGQLRWGLTNM